MLEAQSRYPALCLLLLAVDLYPFPMPVRHQPAIVRAVGVLPRLGFELSLAVGAFGLGHLVPARLACISDIMRPVEHDVKFLFVNEAPIIKDFPKLVEKILSLRTKHSPIAKEARWLRSPNEKGPITITMIGPIKSNPPHRGAYAALACSAACFIAATVAFSCLIVSPAAASRS